MIIGLPYYPHYPYAGVANSNWVRVWVGNCGHQLQSQTEIYPGRGSINAQCIIIEIMSSEQRASSLLKGRGETGETKRSKREDLRSNEGAVVIAVLDITLQLRSDRAFLAARQ